MNHFLVTFKTTTQLNTDFPHDPADFAASATEYVEAQLEEGWKALSISYEAANSQYQFLFESFGC